MSQNDGNFQSKGKKFGGGGKGRGKPGGGGFKKRFEGDSGGFKGGGGKSFDRGAGGAGKFEGRGGKPGYKGRDSGQSRDGGSGKPYEKREWKPREGGGGEAGGYKKREWKPREGGASEGGGGYKKREFKPREGGADRGGSREGGYHQKRDFKPREGGRSEGGGDFKKREWKPREGARSEGGGDFKKREFKSREGSGSGKPYEKREWKPREGGRSEGGGDFKKREFKPREGGERKFVGGGGDKPYRRDEGGHYAGRKSYGAKTGKGDFDRRPRRARDFSIENDIAESEMPVATTSAETRNKLKSDRQSYGSPSSAFLYGVHAVTAALSNPRRLHQRLLVTTSGYEAIRESYEMAQGNGLKLPAPIYVEGVDIERLLPRDAVHQGLLLDSQPLEEFFLADILLSAPDDAKILVLDQVTDPHNVGAILRSAAAFGAVAVVVQKIHAPEITGTLAKSASGAVEHIPVVREVNLTRAIEQLKEAGYFCIGLAEEGKATLAELHSTGKVALVLGAEGDGLRRLVSETCDTLAKLPTGGAISSLNVSNAAAVALYELVRKA